MTFHSLPFGQFRNPFPSSKLIGWGPSCFTPHLIIALAIPGTTRTLLHRTQPHQDSKTTSHSKFTNIRRVSWIGSIIRSLSSASYDLWSTVTLHWTQVIIIGLDTAKYVCRIQLPTSRVSIQFRARSSFDRVPVALNMGRLEAAVCFHRFWNGRRRWKCCAICSCVRAGRIDSERLKWVMDRKWL